MCDYLRVILKSYECNNLKVNSKNTARYNLFLDVLMWVYSLMFEWLLM